MPELIYVSVAVLMGLSALGVAVGVGLLGARFIESVARQPELLGTLRVYFFVIMGLIDAVPMIGVAIGLYILFTAT